MATLKELITKVIPLKGILRTPSYWMRKVLISIADAVEAVQTESRNAESKLQGNIDATKTELRDNIETAQAESMKNYNKLQLEKSEFEYADNYIILRDSKRIIKVECNLIDDGGVRIETKEGTTSITFFGVTYPVVNGVVYTWIPSNTESFANMLYKNISITSVEMPSVDASSVVSTVRMFEGCTSLIRIILPNLKNTKINSTSLMFYGCISLTSLDLSNFDTSAVTSMDYMFYYCSSLTSLDLSNFDTSKVTNMGYMFYYCSSLTSLDLSNFDTSAVTDMSFMFSYCRSLTSLDLSNFDISKVTGKKSMFISCTALKNIKCKQAFKDWCITNASAIELNVANITWEIVE